MKRLLIRLLYWAFRTVQPLGINILPNHYYSSVPDVRALRDGIHWRNRRSMAGIPMLSVDEQVELLGGWFKGIKATHVEGIFERAVLANGVSGYGPVDAVVLAAFIASQKPGRIGWRLGPFSRHYFSL